MGAWGPKLYENDVTNDVRESYIKILKETKDNEKTLSQIFDDYREYMDCYDDGPLFWFSLADTMWDYGRLTEVVKTEALHHIESGEDLKRWEEEGLDDPLYKKRKKELERLKIKLLKEQPKEKRLINRKKYENDWKDGDVYLLPLTDEYAEFAGLKGEYLIFIKDGKILGYPNNKTLAVRTKITTNKKKPQTKKDINDAEYIIKRREWKRDFLLIPNYLEKPELVQEYISNEKNSINIYKYGLIIESKRQEQKFEYLGNFSHLNLPKDNPFFDVEDYEITKYIETKMTYCYLVLNRKQDNFPDSYEWSINKDQYKDLKF